MKQKKAVVYHSKKSYAIYFSLFLVLMVLIAFGGPYLSKKMENSYRDEIDENGKFLKAVVTRKSYKKGRYVHFRYEYGNEFYKNSEMNREYYKRLIIGETIEIKIDSTSPDDSYIFSTGIMQ